MFVLPALEFREEIRKMLDRAFVMNDAVNVLTLIIAGFRHHRDPARVACSNGRARSASCVPSA